MSTDRIEEIYLICGEQRESGELVGWYVYDFFFSEKEAEEAVATYRDTVKFKYDGHVFVYPVEKPRNLWDQRKRDVEEILNER